MTTREAKLVLVGSTNVGKTSIINWAMSNSYDPDQVATVGVLCTSMNVEVSDTKVCLKIFDTAGQERFRSLVPMYYHNANIILVVFAVNDRTSFNTVREMFQGIKEINTEGWVVLCGNKADYEEREVSYDEGSDLANELGIDYYETSAKTGYGITEMFIRTVEGFLKNVDYSYDVKPVPASGKKKCC